MCFYFSTDDKLIILLFTYSFKYQICHKSFSCCSSPSHVLNGHQRCSVKKCVLRNFAEFTEKHLCQSLFFNKVSGLRTATLLKKRLWHRCFPVNFAKFLRTHFSQNTSGRLHLQRFINL